VKVTYIVGNSENKIYNLFSA